MNRSVTVLGQRAPFPVAALAGAILAASVLGALSARTEFPLARFGALVPGRVFAGEVWRLVTWPFFAMEPLTLLFGCWALWWAGVSLTRYWGTGRFLRVSFGIIAGSAILTCLLAWADKSLMAWPFIGPWPLVDALIIAVGALLPDMTVLVFFVVPAQGRMLIYLTVGLTVLYALFEGVPGMLPHFMAEGLMLVYVRGFSLRRVWLRLRLAGLERSFKRRMSPLREVERPERDRPRWFH